MKMGIDERLALIRGVGEEIVTEEELRELLESKKSFTAYDGFEPSGRMHIAQGLFRTININRMIKAGAKFKMLIADWHAWANNKLGGNLENIQRAGEYFIEIWKAAGLDLDNVEFVRVSSYVNDPEYWKKVMQVARNSTIKRIIRCSQIMGRRESETRQASQILYPCMQAADIFHLDVDVCQLGLDQRKVNMLARETATKLGFKKPVIVSHRMLLGLGKPPQNDMSAEERALAMKMSKSNPSSAVFMTDSEEDIKRKLSGAYCPLGVVEDNPVLEYAKHIIFPLSKEFVVERPERFGGDISFHDYSELEEEFINKKLHPADLKGAVARRLNELIEPVRRHFRNNSRAGQLKEFVEGLQVTR